MDAMESQLDLPLGEVLARMQDRIMSRTSYFGVKTLKCPLDFWVYQEMVSSMQPDVILEFGTKFGGSALAFAHMCDNLGHGKVISVDLKHAKVPDKVHEHERITLITGDACESEAAVRALIPPGVRVLIVEDSSHTYDNTLNVLRTYADLVKPGDYFIVEDSICHHGLDVGPQPGPYEAVEAFVAEDDRFEIDRDAESFLITWNPKGYLRRR